jgi:hypothetical protein
MIRLRAPKTSFSRHGAMLPTGGRSGPAPVVCLAGSGEAQRILEKYLEPRPHNNERILDNLVDVLEPPDVLVAVDRLQRGGW